MTVNPVLAVVGPHTPLVDDESSGVWEIRTQNSTYEAARDEHGQWKVRRVTGSADPTPRTGTDGVWKQAEAVYRWLDGVLIVWAGTHCTFTSAIDTVQRLEGDQ